MATAAVERVRAGRYETAYHRAGAGHDRAVLFLHGSGPGVSAMANWRFALPALGDRYDCIAPDLQGFAASEHPADPPQGLAQWLELWMEQLVGLLDALELETVNLVGNSMGGAIALHLASHHPGRFERLVFMGPIGPRFAISQGLEDCWGFYRHPDRDLLVRLMRGFVHNPEVLGRDIEAIVAERWDSLMDPVIRRSFESMFPGDLQEQMDALSLPDEAVEQIEHPSLVLHGREDPYIPLDTSLYLERHLPRAQLHVFDRCSHWIQIERRDAFNELLAFFFEGRLD